MQAVQNLGEFKAQFQEIIDNGLDKRNFLDVTSPATADTEFSIEHGLGYVPENWIVIQQDKAGSAYKGTTTWTTNLAYFKINAAAVALRLMIF